MTALAAAQGSTWVRLILFIKYTLTVLPNNITDSHTVLRKHVCYKIIIEANLMKSHAIKTRLTVNNTME